jgi:hypothetical protein
MLSKTNREDGFLNIFQKIKLKTAMTILLSKTEDQSPSSLLVLLSISLMEI